MRNADQPQPARRVRRVASAAVLGLLALLTSITLGVTATGVASAAPANATVYTADLSPSQASEFTRQFDTLQTSSAVHPNGFACLNEIPACGYVLSKSQTQALWKNVVNRPINAVARYCRDFLSNIGAGGLSYLCDAAANILRNLSAPNGRCLFIGVGPSWNGARLAITYTRSFCS